MTTRIIIHGGIKEFENLQGTEAQYTQSLGEIANNSHRILQQRGARAAVLAAVVALEDAELFNAGTGSRIQADGRIRMSAALMDGNNNVFSGVINIEYVKNPIMVAARLSQEKYPVLAGPAATRFARAHGFESHSPFTEHRLREHLSGTHGLTGTVGAVALDDDGMIFAATSTGGTGGETPGRVSDSATVAGNYASEGLAVSCTGVGENIVNLSVAARIATRQMEGQTLQQAVRKTIEEGIKLGYYFGLIALDRDGNSCVDQTLGKTLYAEAGAKGARTFT